MSIEFARGADVSAELAALRRFWPREGGIAIHAAAVAMRQAGRRGLPQHPDAPGGDPSVERVDGILEPWQRSSRHLHHGLTSWPVTHRNRRSE